MDLKITKTLVIPSNEIKWRFSRSSGPGGQNVNKIESRVEIIFNLEDSKVLNDYQKEILKRNLKNKLVNNSLRIAVQQHRNQLLKESDGQVSEDMPEDVKNKITIYRQALRDLPDKLGHLSAYRASQMLPIHPGL